MKVYIAGKITGFPGYKEKFKAAEDKLKAEGHVVLNPTILPEGFTQEEYLRICRGMIRAVEVVYLLDNWRDSYGARHERDFAGEMKKKLRYEEDEKDGQE